MVYYGLGFLAFIITIIAQVFVKSSYNKYKKIGNNKDLTGFEIATKVLEANGINDLYVLETKGELTDHYDPTKKVIRLSNDIFNGKTIAAASVAAHEAGHAIQYKEGNKLIKIRSAIFPLVNFSSQIGYLVITIGLIFGMIQLFYVGIALLCVILAFQLLTLPVEIDASKKALENLQKLELLNNDENDGAKAMLKAAAFTYVASLATTILEIVRLLLLARDRD